MKKISEKKLKEFFDKLSKNLEQEDKESPIFEHLKSEIKYLGDASEFNVMVIYPIMRVIKTFVRTQFNSNNNLAESIYTQYSFYERNIANLCSKFYGSACSVDKTRFLLESAIEWKESNELPEFDWTQQYTFHYPKKGTPEQWMNLIDGLYNLYYGDGTKYLLSLQELIQIHQE